MTDLCVGSVMASAALVSHAAVPASPTVISVNSAYSQYPVYMGDNDYRISFLFTHPNIAAIKFGWGIIMYIWLMWEKLALKDLVKSFVLIILVYIATKSDSCLIVLFFLIFTGLRKYRNIKKYIIF